MGLTPKDPMLKFEQVLKEVVSVAVDPGCPPTLTTALHYAVFPAGHRIRPKLCLAVAAACGDDAPALSCGAAAAIELIHCASLVHDDLPCFDDAETRRGKPSVHKAFGEQLAVLTGDALIVMAFDGLATLAEAAPDRLGPLVSIVAQSAGAPRGIVAGQAWESEPRLKLANYHQEKTGALFAAATMAGAAASGFQPGPWKRLGLGIGEAYQVADDIRDVAATEEEIGKPIGQDACHDRPNIVHDLGLKGAIKYLKDLVRDTVDAIPECPGREQLSQQMEHEARRFLPKKFREAA